MSCKPAQSRRSQTAARGAHDRPAVTSDPPLLPRPTGGRGGQPCRRHATAPGGRASPTSDTPAWKPRPTRQATGAPVAACKQPHRHLCHRRASSVAKPMPRLEATQQRQTGASVKATESGPAVIAVAGGRAQRSRRQPGSRPILRQQESPLSRREDGAPVTRCLLRTTPNSSEPALSSGDLPATRQCRPRATTVASPFPVLLRSIPERGIELCLAKDAGSRSSDFTRPSVNIDRAPR